MRKVTFVVFPLPVFTGTVKYGFSGSIFTTPVVIASVVVSGVIPVTLIATEHVAVSVVAVSTPSVSSCGVSLVLAVIGGVGLGFGIGSGIGLVSGTGSMDAIMGFEKPPPEPPKQPISKEHARMTSMRMNFFISTLLVALKKNFLHCTPKIYICQVF